MSRALDILNRKAPNTAGLLVLNPQEVEEIKGEIGNLRRQRDNFEVVLQGLKIFMAWANRYDDAIEDLKYLNINALLKDVEQSK